MSIEVQTKRGRKKDTVNKKSLNVVETTKFGIDINANNNIQLIIEEDDTIFGDETHMNTENNNNIDPNINIPKKRGRKPKGGNLITKQPELYVPNKSITNVILHLKCSSNDLIEYNNNINKIMTNPHIYNPEIPPDILTYNDEITAFSYYNEDKNNMDQSTNEINNDNKETNFVPLTYNNANAYTGISTSKQYCSSSSTIKTHDHNIIGDLDDTDDINVKDINNKLKKLKVSLYKNNLNEKKSACFWCTCDFDNQTCYIPKYEVDGAINGYGSFCRPECAVAFLMKENIDDSMKFERYHLLNQIYSKIYNFKKSIKQAPNPYYLLDKFFGNLTIQEYRKLLKTNHMLLVIDKPLTRILPELHEDNEDMMLNLYGSIKSSSQITSGSNTAGVYKVKRQSEKPQGPSKSSIIRENFCGL